MVASERARIGSELRRFREAAGVSGTAVAEALGWSQSKVSRVETGRFGASLGELATLLDYYGAPEEVRAELVAAAARDHGVEGAWLVRAGGPRRRHGEMAAIEERVRSLRQYHVTVVPGLLQSPSYARAVLDAGGFEDAAAIAGRRQDRQIRFATRSDVRYEVVLDARALRRWPGDRAVHIEQVDHLLAAVESSKVELRILADSSAGTAWVLSPFLLYEFTQAPTLVLCETRTADLYLSAAADVEVYGDLFGRLKSDALSPADSVEVLKDLRRQFGSPRKGRKSR